MSWRLLEAGAPEIARVFREQLARHHVALLGSVRADGGPRISPVEPAIVEGELVLGIMASPKVDDLRHEPRCVVHSLVVDDSGAEPEVKLSGRAIATEDPRILGAPGTWWADRSDATTAAFILDLDEAVLVDWRTGDGRMAVSRWRPGQPMRTSERRYP